MSAGWASSMKLTLAGGLDGLLPQHLKDLVSCRVGDVGERLIDRLAEIFTVVLQGKVPANNCPFLCGGALTALNKKNGGIRSIACGNTLRRLLGKILGYGTPGNAEAVVHATRSFLSEEGKAKVLLKLDFKNAFNTIDRTKLLQALRADLPDYYALVWQMYRHSSELFFGDFVPKSESGV
ncbi:hypothetical protein BV898_18422 [Hypsibius exemplaris]|uniref:Reverse transcriptase domain-containing protein n=1 Tax=Hypsibius exemplaris TaxID=2072580 RepID=A0A9X6NIT1_HYPEX|nr:hypothetical protein BV898_18422 [Hypsibius exemplaris]